jgi:hypothetical protein
MLHSETTGGVKVLLFYFYVSFSSFFVSFLSFVIIIPF